MAALQNDALKDLDKAESKMSSQNYSYMTAIPDPETVGVGSQGSFGQVSTNINAAFRYVDILGSTNDGMGDSYLLNTGGSCISPSGTLEDRYNYVNNRPTDKPLVGRSLISGIADDIMGMNPMSIFKAIKANGTPPCQKYKCEVTNQVNGDTQYLTPELSPDFKSETCKMVPEPSDPDAAMQTKIDALSKRVNELQSLVASNPDNEALKEQLSTQQNALSDLLQTKLDMVNRREQYKAMTRETFEVMNSPALGGVLLAGILLGILVFRR
jgi:hypothetical protein